MNRSSSFCIEGAKKETGDGRTGATFTSATGLHVCVNILADGQQGVANRFAGISGNKGLARHKSAEWTPFVSGAPVLVDALAAIDCEVEEVMERHSRTIILGRAGLSQTLSARAIIP